MDNKIKPETKIMFNCKTQRIASLIILGTLTFAMPVSAQESFVSIDTAQKINSANELVRQGNFDKAIEEYQQLTPNTGNRDELNYNQAVAQFRKGDVQSAQAMFTEAATSADTSIAASSRYNLGNCVYSTALKTAEQDKPAAIEQLREAISHYRDSLRLSRDNADARANIELAAEMIRKLQEAQKQEEQQKQDQQQQDQKQDENQDSQDQQSQDQQSKDQQSQDSQSQENQEQKQDQQNQSEQSNSDQQNSDQQNSEQQSDSEQSDSEQSKDSQNQSQAEGEQSKENESVADQTEQNNQQNDSHPNESKDGESNSEESQKDKAGQPSQPEDSVNEQTDSQDQKSQQEQQPQSNANNQSQQNQRQSQADQPSAGEPQADEQIGEEEKGDSQVPAGQLTATGDQNENGKPTGSVAMADPNAKDGLMTKEEAMKMLQAVRDRDMLRRLRQQQLERSRHVPVDKDW